MKINANDSEAVLKRDADRLCVLTCETC